MQLRGKIPLQLRGKIPFTLLVSIALFASGCNGVPVSGGGGSTPLPSTANEWTWMSGSSTVGAKGVYGTKGSASTNNVPGARSGSVSWIDSSGNLWLFGGSGGAGDPSGYLNDLWEFKPSSKEWTWISGSNTGNTYGAFSESGIYGTQGVASANNVPPPRDSAVSWTDSSGNLWLFGGEGFISSTANGMFNDLWEFNPTTKEWTWVSGSNTINAKGVYGTLNLASANNVPGARGSGGSGAALSWTDTGGNFWLFGGSGLDSTGAEGYLNDLWEFNATAKTWTWVGGSKTANAAGVYGAQNVTSVNNVPGARSYAVSWRDNSGNSWLYGGEGYGPTGIANGDLSDLWQFNSTTKQWMWVSGSNAGSVVPVYGTQGVASASNTPGGRDSAVSWTDSSGNFWLFGGFDYDGGATNQILNDLWKFSPTTKEWTWVGGSNTGETKGVYGTLGTASTSNVPGARGSQGIAVTWTDSSGNLWLFGGIGYDFSGTWGSLNDLWRYQP
jgi:N-acetylneuraminic acid mutarotase